MGAVEIYCEAVERLSRDLCALDVKSRGLRAFREYLTEYAASVSFRDLVTEAEKLKSDLSAITVLPAHQGRQRHGSPLQRRERLQRCRRRDI